MKLRNLFNLNSIKANLKLKQTTTVGQTIAQGSTSHESKLDIGQWANFVTASEQKSIKAVLNYNIYIRILNTWLQKRF